MLVSLLGGSRIQIGRPTGAIVIIVSGIMIDLIVVVEVGVVLAALLFIRRMSEVTNAGMITRELRGYQDEPADPNSLAIRKENDGVEVFEIQSPFFFGEADRFTEALRLTSARYP